jgi:hypothetical protein
LDRQIVYPGAVPLETDILNTNKNAMFALGQFAQDVFGTATVFNGLACVPNTPAAMNVIVQPGVVYAQAALDATAYSSLAADSTVTQKQGILKTAQTFATPAPVTSGQSIVYLISASFLEADTGATVLPYYNASNPAQAYSGPNNLGTSQNTLRQDTVQLTLTTGVPATTGSQLTPATPNGQTALYTVTVAYGAATVVAGNIAKASGAPFLTSALLAQIQARALLNGDSTQTFSVGPATLSQHAMQLGQFSAAAVSAGLIKTVKYQIFTSSGTYTPSTGMVYCVAEVIGGGGGGGGSSGGSSASGGAGGGGAGGYGKSIFPAATIGASQVVTVGAAGTGGSVGANNGGTGGASSVGALITSNGGAGGTNGTSNAAVGSLNGGGGGGTAASAQINVAGQQGLSGVGYGSVSALGGSGGNGPFGTGGSQAIISAGNAATGRGAGGGGAASLTTSFAGGNGSGGIVVIQEFCSQ